MNKKKLIIVGIVIIVLFVLLFPIKLRYKDGGSVCYRALLYSVTKWHQLDDNQVDGYKDGLEIKILGMTVCDRSYDDPVSEKPNTETGNVVNFQNNTIEPAVSAPNEDEDEKSFTYNIAFANWTDDSKIYAAALNGKTMLVSSVQHLPVYKFDTAPELDTFKTTYGDILTMDQGLDETPSFSYITAAYDDSFFSRYSILLAYVPTSSSSYRFGVSDVYCDGQSFCMYIEQLNNPETHDDMMAGWFAIVEVTKEDIENCAEYDAQLRHKSTSAGIADTEKADIRKEVCELYLGVLEDLWNVDPGLNSGITQIGIDLSELSQLTEAEKETVMADFASKHNLPYIVGTWEELCEQGYIDKDNLCWEDGLFFSIKTNEDASFDAQKWRSGLGAYFLSQCTAHKNADGTWSYTVGYEAIS